uniref:Uncharacterized protein n=1 Tax=Rhizophora mucronata TaxID=61149 RepID=A0A2P2MXC4_RHIMU
MSCTLYHFIKNDNLEKVSGAK